MIHIGKQLSAILFTSLGILLSTRCDESTAPGISSLQNAERNVFVNLLNSNDSGKVGYELVYPLNAGTVIKATPPLDSIEYTAPAYSWFFFIDDHPNLRWVHECRYVFSDAYTDTLSVYNGLIYPECFNDMKIVIFQ
jgi:hypothetical protein